VGRDGSVSAPAADGQGGSQQEEHAEKQKDTRKEAKSSDGQGGSQQEEHAEKQKDTRKEAKAVSEKTRTENVPGERTGEPVRSPPFKDPTFKDLNSVFKFSDDFFIGKKSFISCILFMCRERRNPLRSFSSFSVQMDCLADSLNDRFFKGECHSL
jgi:hypothetical protein